MAETERFLSPKQVCERIGRSYRWLLDARKIPDKGPPGFKIGGRMLYRPEDVKNWFESQRFG